MSHPDPIHLPILRHSKISDRLVGLPRAMDIIKHKYGSATNSVKRTSSVPLTDEVCMSLPDLQHDGAHITTCSNVTSIIQALSA